MILSQQIFPRNSSCLHLYIPYIKSTRPYANFSKKYKRRYILCQNCENRYVPYANALKSVPFPMARPRAQKECSAPFFSICFLSELVRISSSSSSFSDCFSSEDSSLLLSSSHDLQLLLCTVQSLTLSIP